MKIISKILRKHWPLFCMMVFIAVIVGYIVKSSDIVFNLTKQRIADVDHNEGLNLQEASYSHESDEIKWNIDAEKVQFSENQQLINFTDFLLTVSPKDRNSFKVSGEKASYNKTNGTIYMSGNVVCESADGYKLETAHVSVNEQTKEMKSDAFVKITGPFFIITGSGFEGHLTQQQFKVLSDANTNIDKEVL